jgi:hypothetical protein
MMVFLGRNIGKWFGFNLGHEGGSVLRD